MTTAQIITNENFIYGELVTQIYEGPLEPSPWKSFLSCLRTRLNCDSSAITLRPARPGRKSITVWDRRVPLTEVEKIEVASEHARLADSDPLGNALCKPGDMFTLDEVISNDELMKSEFYQKIIDPYGIHHQLGMCISQPDGWICHIGVSNHITKPNFGESEKRLLSALRPHFERSLQIYAKMKRHELERDIYEDALNRLTIGAIILDGRNKVLEINDAAMDIINNSSCLSLASTNELVCAQYRYRAELSNLVRQAVTCRAMEPPRAFVSPLRIRSNSGECLDLLVRSAPVSPWYQNDLSPSVIIYLNDMSRQQSFPEQLIGLLLGLTPTETHFAVILANGYTLMAAAKMMGLTENSARTYSKTIFSKLGISRQVDLVRLILRSVALLGGAGTPSE